MEWYCCKSDNLWRSNSYSKSKDEIPAEVAAHYVERDGAWVLDAVGTADKAKLDEFRNNNVELLKQLEEQRKRFEGIDPEQVRKLSEEKQRLEDEQRVKAGEFDKVLDGRLKSAKAEWEKQFSAVTSERDALSSRLTVIQIDQGVITAATKRGLRATALPDITARAQNVFKLVNGVPTAFEVDGKTIRNGKDGIAPMTLEEWLDAQVSETPHLFESNAGGGAAGNGPGGVGDRSVKNPYRKETWNLTEQMKLQRTDPQSRLASTRPLSGLQPEIWFMAKTGVADIIIPTEFEKYAIERTAELAQFGQCGIVEAAPEFDVIASEAGGREVRMPFWKDLTAGRGRGQRRILRVHLRLDPGLEGLQFVNRRNRVVPQDGRQRRIQICQERPGTSNPSVDDRLQSLNRLRWSEYFDGDSVAPKTRSLDRTKLCLRRLCKRKAASDERPRLYELVLLKKALLVVAARLVDLQVAGADDCRVGRAGSNLQNSRAANHNVQVEQVAARAAVVIVHCPRDKRHRNGVRRIAADATQDAVAMEVDDIHGDLR